MSSVEPFPLSKIISQNQHCARFLLLSSYIDISHLYKEFQNVNIHKILNKHTSNSSAFVEPSEICLSSCLCLLLSFWFSATKSFSLNFRWDFYLKKKNKLQYISKKSKEEPKHFNINKWKYYLLGVHLSRKFAIVDPKININVVMTILPWQ